MIHIEIINCNQCEINGPWKILNKLYEEFSIKHPNWFYLRTQVRNKNWDGYIRFISASGTFKIGLLSTIYNRLKELNQKCTVTDSRRYQYIKPTAVNSVGSFVLRPEQSRSLKILLSNRIGDNKIPYYIGVGDLPVNFGKSLLFAALYHSFKGKVKTLLLTNDSDWLAQSRKEFTELISKEDLTFVQGGKVFNWGNFSIGMVQSIAKNALTYERELAQVGMLLIDEADIINNNTYKEVINKCYNAWIKFGLSGTIYMSNLKRDLLHNLTIKSFIGEKLVEYKLHQMIKKGRSTNVIVKLVPVKTDYKSPKKKKETYQDQYEKVIFSKKSLFFSLKRAKMYLNSGRYPILVVTKYIKHCEKLYNLYKKKLGDTYSIAYIHNEVTNRELVLKKFRKGKIDILISTTIISRGKNIPLIKYLQNAADIDSNERVIQILGRSVRKHDSKSKVYLDDFIYPGGYLNKHANHRRRYYKKEKLKVIDLTKKKRFTT